MTDTAPLSGQSVQKQHRVEVPPKCSFQRVKGAVTSLEAMLIFGSVFVVEMKCRLKESLVCVCRLLRRGR